MEIDINALAAEMLSVVKDTVKDNWKHVKGTATGYINNKKDRLELLASLRLNNEIEEEFFLKRLNYEKKILESELLSLKILTKAIAQKAANAAFDVFNKFIESLIKVI